MKFYVYALFRPSGEIFYVGKGKGNRLDLHWARKDTNQHVKNILEKAKRDGVECSRRILRDELEEDAAHALERVLIGYLGREDLGLGPLVNLTDGGEGMANPCAATRAKLSRHQTTRIRKAHTEETKAKISAAKIGQPWNVSPDELAKKAELCKQRIWTGESREKCRLAAIAREAAMTSEQRSERAREREAKKKANGYKFSELTKLKLRLASAERGPRKPHSQASKDKMSAAKRGMLQ